MIDALDECDNDRDVRMILKLLSQVKNLEAIQLQVFVTSRPEHPILSRFHMMLSETHQDFMLYEIDSSIVKQDITLFLEEKLALVQREYQLSSLWPDKSTIDLLVERAGGLFIYAATIYRFIRNPLSDLQKQLSKIIEGRTTTQLFTKHLDTMYIQVLKYSIIQTCGNDIDLDEALQ